MEHCIIPGYRRVRPSYARTYCVGRRRYSHAMRIYIHTFTHKFTKMRNSHEYGINQFYD